MKTHYEILNSNRQALIDIKAVAFMLEKLSQSFYHTGNDRMGDDLWAANYQLLCAADIIKVNNSESLNLHLKDVQQSTANMLGAALAVASKK